MLHNITLVRACRYRHAYRPLGSRSSLKPRVRPDTTLDSDEGALHDRTASVSLSPLMHTYTPFPIVGFTLAHTR